MQKPWDDTTLVEVVQREVDEGQATRRRDAQARARAGRGAADPARAAAVDDAGGRTAATIAARWTPASGIGGDCYDVLRFSDTRVGVSIADVVGKGLPAALLMSNLQAAVRAFATAQAEPHDVVRQRQPAALPQHRGRQVRDVLLRGRRHRTARSSRTRTPGTFLRSLVHAQRRGRTARDDGPRAGRLARLDVLARPRSRSESGDRLVCFTDGITEALSPDGDEFGDDRLVDLIRANRTISADALATTLADTQAAWTGGSAQDDATLIVVAID